MRHVFDNQSHFAFENVNDLLLRMRMCRHSTPRGECGEHLVHRFAMRDRPPRDAGTNFNRRIFSFHAYNLTKKCAMNLSKFLFFLVSVIVVCTGLAMSSCCKTVDQSVQLQRDSIAKLLDAYIAGY